MSKFSCVLHHVPQKLLWPSCTCKGVRGGDSQSVLLINSSSSSTAKYSRCPTELRAGPTTSSSSSEIINNKSGWGIGWNSSSRRQSPTWSSTASTSTRAFAGSGGNTIGTMAKAPPVVFCGPSGAGKSTLVKKLLEEFSDVFGFSISHTTRKPRAGESDGRDYYFVAREVMEEAIKKGEFIEHAEFSGNLYGTSKQAVEEVQKKGKMCILDIDTQGVKQIKKTNLQPRLIFIKPPSLADLENRLRLRGTETEESLKRRLAAAQTEIEYGEAPGNFDLVLVNDQVEPAYQKLRAFLLPDITELRNFLAKSNPNLVYQNGSGDKN